MDRIIFPLTSGMRGQYVANLQEGLLLLLQKGVIQVAEEERPFFEERLRQEQQEQVYQDITQRLVFTFQEQHRLAPNGEVDEPTANALNAVLQELGAFGPATRDEQRLVGGQVRRDDDKPFPGGLVRAFHVGEPGMLRLGEDTTDDEGRYTIRYTMLPGVGTIQLHVVVFDSNGKPLRESDVIHEAKPLEIVDIVVPSVDHATILVEGKVASRLSAGVGGLRVQIVDKTVGDDVPLGEDVTDEGGEYQTAFTDADLRRRGKVRPDLQARVFAGGKFLAASDVRYNASNRETLNVLLDEKAVSALRSEHETLTSNLSSYFTGKLGELQETGDRQDITYLANKTSWDARAVALAALADQFSARTTDPTGNDGIEPAFFYALFRAGLPANDAALYQTNPKTAEAVWKQAITQGMIPAELENSVPRAVEQFQSLAARHILDAPALVGVSSLKEMLSVSLGVDPEPQRQEEREEKFADLYTRHRDDLPKFWEEVQRVFGEPAEKRLKLDGQLAYLTFNNAPLIRKLHGADGHNGLSDPLDLVEGGYYQAGTWQEVIGGDPIPPEIPGENDTEKRSNYAELLAGQVRLSFPTAVVAQMVKKEETSILIRPKVLEESGEDPDIFATKVRDGASQFLIEHHGKFEIGLQPIEQYIIKNGLDDQFVALERRQIVEQITRIQRVYQITPNDDAMNVLLKKGVDSAYAVTRYDQDEFVQSFKDEVGGEANARLIHAKSQQVHNTVLNVAVSYLAASNAPGIGVHSPAGILNPAPSGPNPNASDVIAYPTLEALLGEMDYCACEHCRSILSPAAYLVDLLQYIDLRRYDSQGVELPKTYEEQNPLDVLLDRRPDIQHLPLTCENTNTPLPYIDLVNEALEYYVISDPASVPPKPPLSLVNYTGHTTDDSATPEELLASPMFVHDAAYTTLAGAHFPPPLPFHQPLENLRRYFDKFKVPLPEVMEALRKDNNLERPDPVDPANPGEFGWRDILMEELKLSRAEYELLTARALTNGTTDVDLTLKRLYGFDRTTPVQDVRNVLDNAKKLCRRVGITYEDLIEILGTRFVNPNSTLIPKLERLGVPFVTLKALKDSLKTGQDWLDLLPSPLPDVSQYGGNIEVWVKNVVNYANIISLITLTDPKAADAVCGFDELEFRYADPDKLALNIRPFEFVRLIRFIRLWKKLGWTIEQTDKAITTLYPADQTPNDPNDDAVNLERLDAGFLTLLPRLGVVKRVMEALKLTPKKDLQPLLACFAPIDTHGNVSLYRQMFLSPSLLKQDPAFADDGYGNFLTDNTQKLTAHAEALRAAFLLTEEEFILITDALGFDPSTLLTLDNISAVFRRGWLARKLKLSIQELLLLTTIKHQPLTTFTSIDPYAPPDPPSAPILCLIELVDRLRAVSLKPTQALYLIWNQDITGKSAPDDAEISGFARVLRSDLAAIESEFAIADDPDGQIAQARMTLVYGKDATDLFFGFLSNAPGTDVPYSRGQATLVTQVAYSHGQATLEQAILNAAPGLIAYDNSLKRLSFTGALTTATRDKLKAVAGVTAQFRGTVDSLYVESQKVIKANLEQLIVNVASGRIAYDDFRKLLSFTGVLTMPTRETLKAAAETALSSEQAVNDFKAAVDNLYAANQKIVGPFFARYPELQPLYNAYVASNDTAVAYSHGQPSLEQAILDAASGRIAYDDARKQLSYRGQLTPTIRNALESVSGVSDQFKEAVGSLYVENQNIVGPFLADDPELLELYEALVAPGQSPGKKRSALIEHLLPELKRRRKRQQALQAISASAKIDASFASALLDDAGVLHAAGNNSHTALADLTALETPGLSAQFFYADNAAGNPNITRDVEANLAYFGAGNNKLPPNGNNPANAVSGIWSGYLEAPENGFYNLRIEADAGATITLTLNDKTVALAENNNIWSNNVAIELRAGTLYLISLKVEEVKDTFSVQWQTMGRGWEVIPERYLYSATLTDHLRQVYVRFLKAASLATSLKLTATETAYFASHADYQIDGQGWLNSVPVTGNPDNTTSKELLKAFTALLDFTRIKADLSPSDERLLTVLRDPAAATQKPERLLFTLTRWESNSLGALLGRFGKANTDLTNLETFRRVYDAYAPVKKMGIPASSLIKAATNDPSAATVRDLQSALRARYDESDWLKVLKPINDEMRDLQRNALVAYILHQMGAKPASAHIDTPEKLFEYFLMDVQMEPCMETSRIRHALSSVQLFIERCLMNLETGVAPSSINAKQWEWMSRYRVWEANRKVFLHPENLLEPELRDDQSPFFKETMSELLQSDITEDAAATALLNYLSKLEEVAKLEPCGIHYVEDDPNTKGKDDIAHVVARTAGANRKYFYRRREGGSWTPWEQIKLDIEDNPVVPVVWKDRLFLFWLRILQQAPLNAPTAPTPGQTFASVPASNYIMSGLPQVTVQAVLCWSEYYNGKWQATKTSDVNRPTLLGWFDPAGQDAFDRSDLLLSAQEVEAALQIVISGLFWSSFLLYNTHSLPLREDDIPADLEEPKTSLKTRSIDYEYPDELSHAIIARYETMTGNTAVELNRPVLRVKRQTRHRTVEPRHYLQNPWDAPFFFEDSRHVFYVTTTEEIVTIPEHNGYLTMAEPNYRIKQMPPLVFQEEMSQEVSADKLSRLLIVRDPGVIDLARMERFVSEDAYIDKAIGTIGTVRYGETKIGPAGGLMNGMHNR